MVMEAICDFYWGRLGSRGGSAIMGRGAFSYKSKLSFPVVTQLMGGPLERSEYYDLAHSILYRSSLEHIDTAHR